MGRKRRLSRGQNDLLRMLEEAGEENLACILNTLRLEPDANRSVSQEFARDVEDLVRQGLVRWTKSDHAPMSMVEFDSVSLNWRSSMPERCSLLITKAGARALTE